MVTRRGKNDEDNCENNIGGADCDIRRACSYQICGVCRKILKARIAPERKDGEAKRTKA